MNNRNNLQINHRILLLGIGAAKDRALKANLMSAFDRLQINLPIEEVTDLDLLMAYGITGIPALIIDEKVVFQKIVPSVDDLVVVLSVLVEPQVRSPLLVRQIIVPTDFSEASENALNYAAFLADEFHSAVRLVHIQDPESAVMGGVFLFEDKKNATTNKEKQLGGMIRRAQKALEQNNKPAVTINKEIIQGLVPEELQRLSNQSDTDLIVMGIDGDQGLIPQWFEPPFTEVARRASCPVLLIPQNSHFEGFRNVIYASNRGSVDEKTWKRVLELTGQFNANLHFVHLNSNSNAPTSVLASLINDQGSAFHLAAINQMDLEAGIQQYIQQHHAELLIMNAPHRHFFQDIFHHQHITYHMALNTQTPLMILHDGE
jgi:nucleotide-binding universal stress UspA family protein